MEEARTGVGRFGHRGGEFRRGRRYVTVKELGN